MRHLKKGKTLGRESAARKALLKNLAASLILYEKVKTTEAKAKVLRPLVEKMITRAKTNTLHNRRELLKKLPTENAVNKLMDILGPRYRSKPGGYSRIVKLPVRLGDAARMAQIELINQDEK